MKGINNKQLNALKNRLAHGWGLERAITEGVNK